VFLWTNFLVVEYCWCCQGSKLVSSWYRQVLCSFPDFGPTCSALSPRHHKHIILVVHPSAGGVDALLGAICPCDASDSGTGATVGHRAAISLIAGGRSVSCCALPSCWPCARYAFTLRYLMPPNMFDEMHTPYWQDTVHRAPAECILYSLVSSGMLLSRMNIQLWIFKLDK